MDIVTLGAALKGAKSYTDATIAPLLGGVRYRGSVNYFSSLPSNPAEGDAYTVKYSGTSGTTPDGTEYVWGLDNDDNTYKWIGFSSDTYTKSEVDALLSPIETNISTEQGKTVGMTAGGSNYITVGGIRVYVSSTAPTGDIPDGSVGVGW